MRQKGQEMEGNNTIYIHYGHSSYNKSEFTPIRNVIDFTKPRGGLWASPIDAPYGWRQWCEQEEFRKCKERESFKFTLSPTAKILHIRSIEDCEFIPTLKSSNRLRWFCPNYEKLMKGGFDGVEVHISDDYNLYYKLYGWDCDSIVIMNKDIVVPI